MSDIFKVTINERQYTGHKFNPIDAIDFCLELGKLDGDFMTPDAKPVIMKAIRQCFNGQNQSLNDEMTFHNQFSAYPSDVFPLAFAAIKHLSEDFFAPTVNTPAPELEKQKKGGK
jgi:hypothetical protein